MNKVRKYVYKQYDKAMIRALFGHHVDVGIFKNPFKLFIIMPVNCVYVVVHSARFA